MTDIFTFSASIYTLYSFSFCGASAHIPGMASPFTKLPDINQTHSSP